jgi:hypothetical protein
MAAFSSSCRASVVAADLISDSLDSFPGLVDLSCMVLGPLTARPAADGNNSSFTVAHLLSSSQ